MAYIKSGIILIWTGTNATIPTGWVRETTLDDRFPKATAAGVNPNVTGGANTHTHTSPEHTHAIQAHRHYGNTSREGEYETRGGGSSAARDAHIHDFDFTQVNSDGNLHDAITYQSGNSLPPYRKVIFIKPSGSWAALQDNIVALWNSATIPDGWNFCNGSDDTPDLRNRYLRGASAGADSDTTTDNGSLSHSHDVSHTHTARTHTHTGSTGYDSDYSADNKKDTWSGGGSACDRHTHTVTLNASIAQAGSAYSGTVNNDGATEPLYKKLLAIKNNTGRVHQPRNIIGMWLGSLTAIPFGWVLCDGNNGTPDMRGYHLKIANTTGEIGNTGGSNTHSHAASNSHTHTTAATHSHTGSTSYFPQTGTTTADNNGVSKGHSHEIATARGGSCSSSGTTWASTTISADSANNEPAYRTVAFIQYQKSLLPGLITLLL